MQSSLVSLQKSVTVCVVFKKKKKSSLLSPHPSALLSPSVLRAGASLLVGVRLIRWCWLMDAPSTPARETTPTSSLELLWAL